MVSPTIRGVVGIFYYPLPGKPKLLRWEMILVLAGAILLSAVAAAQTTVKIVGRVFDAADGSTLPGAIVAVRGGPFQARCDAFGRFEILSIPDGQYAVFAAAEGYKPSPPVSVTVTADNATVADFRLERVLYQMPARVVLAPSPPALSQPIVVLDRETIARSKPADIGEILERVEGVQIRRSGNAGDPVEISIRGSESRHVLVLVDGQRLGQSGEGQIALSAVPVDIIERIEVIRGGASARFGPDAIGGVINIITVKAVPERSPEISLTGEWGQWKSNRRRASASDIIPVANFSSRIVAEAYVSNGDFPYCYSYSPRPDLARLYTGVRRNAQADLKSLFASASYQIGPRLSAALSAHYYRQRRGLPGPVSEPDTIAFGEDRRSAATIEITTALGTKHLLTACVSAANNRQQFDNTAGRTGLFPGAYHDRFNTDSYRLQIRHRWSPGRATEISAGAEGQLIFQRQDNFILPDSSIGLASCRQAAAVLSGRQNLLSEGGWLVRTITVDGSTRLDAVRIGNPRQEKTKLRARLSHQAGGAVSGGGRLQYFLRGSYGTSFSLPSFNALFWKGDVRSGGNANLRPETAEHSEIGLEISARLREVTVSAGVTCFHTYVRDLIIWQPTVPLGIWKPVNLDASRITGHEDFLRLRLFADRLSLSYQNTVLSPKNRSVLSGAYNQDLTYRPRFHTVIDISWKSKYLLAGYSVRMVGRRYSLPANTKWYDAYRVDDAHIGLSGKTGNLKGNVIYRVDNINGTAYELIGRYPMPGRNWSIELTIGMTIS